MHGKLTEGSGLRRSIPAFPLMRSRSAINRAMATVPGNSIVVLLSTSALLLPRRIAAPSPGGKHGEDADFSSMDEPTDIFLAYERLQSNMLVSRPAIELAREKNSSGLLENVSRPSIPRGDGKRGAEWVRYDRFGHQTTIGHKSEGLLVSAFPSRSRMRGRREDDVLQRTNEGDGDKSVPSVREEEQSVLDQRHKSQPAQEEHSTNDKSLPTTAQRQARIVRLSQVAPLPLLVFDSETFWAVGGFDEGFAFQGGVAEWISRTKPGHIVDGHCFDASSGQVHPTTEDSKSTAGPSARTVQHVHEHEWGSTYVSPWTEEGARGYNGHQSSCSTLKHQNHESIVDKWTRISSVDLDALVQADADLFFYRLVLSWPSSGERVPSKILE